jgi:replicative DNA helicase
MKEQAPQLQPRLTTDQVEFCFVHMLRNPDLFALARQNLDPNSFSPAGEMHLALVWSAALAVAERNGGALPQESTEICIGAELVSRVSAAGTEVVPEAAKSAESLVVWIFGFKTEDLNPAFYRGLILDLIAERGVLQDLNRMQTQVRMLGLPLDLPERLELTARRIRDAKLLGRQVPQNLRDAWPDFQSRLQAYRGRDFLGLRTGLPQLDDHTLGLRGLALLGAMPNVGKTALVLHMGIHVIRNNLDACFLFISLEMDRASLLTRIYCNLAEMDWGTLVRGDKNLRGGKTQFFTPDQQKRLQDADQWIAQHGHRIRVLDRHSFSGGISASSILREMTALKAQCGATRAFVVIDYLQVLPIPDTVRRTSDLDADKYQIRVAQDILAGMQQSESSLLGDAVIAISETRKPATGRKHWGEDLADLMGSARLGYGADAVLLYRRLVDDDAIADVYDAAGRDTAPTAGQLENEGIAPILLSLAKGRDGMRLGEWPLEYHFNRSIFREIERRRQPMLPAGRRVPPRPLPPPVPPISDLEKYD